MVRAVEDSTRGPPNPTPLLAVGTSPWGEPPPPAFVIFLVALVWDKKWVPRREAMRQAGEGEFKVHSSGGRALEVPLSHKNHVGKCEAGWPGGS